VSSIADLWVELILVVVAAIGGWVAKRFKDENGKPKQKP
jgi:hypothetical protein